MSLIKSATRRLSLLAGSSLVVAGLATAAPLMLAPTAAFAADECTPGAGTVGNGPGPVSDDPTLNGADAPDVFVCAPGTYASGIRYDSDGDLSVTATLPSNFGTGTGGIRTYAGSDPDDADDNISLELTGQVTGTVNLGAAPVALDARSEAGNVSVEVSVTRSTSGSYFIGANNAAATHFIRAISNAGGDVDVTHTGSVTIFQANNGIAIEARSIGGGDVTVDMGASNVVGRLYGVLASATGAGTVTIGGSGRFFGQGPVGVGVAGIRASTGSGALNISAGGTGSNSADGIYATSDTGQINITVEHVDVTAAAGAAIRASTAGDFILSVSAGRTVSASGSTNAALELTAPTGSDFSITNAGTISGGGSGLALRASGAGALSLESTGLLLGRLDLASHSGGATISIGGPAAAGNGWRTTGTSNFGSGADTVSIGEGGFILASPRIGALDSLTTFDFGSGDDVLQNSGTILVGPRDGARSQAGQLSITGLETFDNAGVIYLGALFANNAVAQANMLNPANADGRTDDVLRMDGGVFNGLEGSRVILDVDLSKQQLNCTDRVEIVENSSTGPVTTFALPAADCLDLRGGSTDGSTLLSLRQVTPTLRGAYNPTGIVVVDVGGAGTSALGHFIIAPDSFGYSDAHGGVVDKGEFFYTLVYDADQQQHKLVGLPGQNLYQLPGLALAAQSVWRTSTGDVIARPGERRISSDDGTGGDLWLRGTGEFGSRDVAQGFEFEGSAFDFDNTYDQRTIAITGGGDMMWGTDDASYIVGAAVGAVRTDLEYDASPNTVEMRGFNVGFYGGMTLGAFYLDAAVNGVGMTMENDMPALNLLPEGRLLTTKLQTIGLQAEAGWRVPLAQDMFVEPLVSLAFAETKFDDLGIGVSGDFLAAGNVGEFEKTRTARVGAGARFASDADYGPVLMRFFLTGRVWHETDGDAAVNVLSAGPDVVVNDAFTGTFSDIGGTVSVSDESGMLNAFIEAGGKFGDDYQSTSVSGGVRYRW